MGDCYFYQIKDSKFTGYNTTMYCGDGTPFITIGTLNVNSLLEHNYFSGQLRNVKISTQSLIIINLIIIYSKSKIIYLFL